MSDNFAIYGPEYRIRAQFSIPYVVTMAVMGEPTGPNWYRDELLFDPKVRAFQHKVRLAEDRAATDNFYPGYKAPSTVEVVMKDGTSYTETVEYPKGEPRIRFRNRIT